MLKNNLSRAAALLLFLGGLVFALSVRTAVTTALPVQTEHEVEVADFAFSPDDLTISAGDTVVWRRQNGAHNVRAEDGSFDSGAPSNTWSEFRHTFDEPGVYEFYCSAHGAPDAIRIARAGQGPRPAAVGMAGRITVLADEPLDSLYLPSILRN